MTRKQTRWLLLGCFVIAALQGPGTWRLLSQGPDRSGGDTTQRPPLQEDAASARDDAELGERLVLS